MKIPNEQVQMLLDALKALRIEDVFVQATDEGWEVRAVDASHVSMVRTRLSRSCFGEDYTPDGFKVAVDRMASAMSLTGGAAEMDIAPGMMTLHGNRMAVKVPLLDAEDAVLARGLKLEPTCRAQVSSDEIRRIVKASSAVKSCTQVVFRISADGVEMSCRGDGGAGSTLTVPGDECPVLEGEAVCRFGAANLEEVMRAVPRGAVVDLVTDTDMPLVVRWSGEGWWMDVVTAPEINQEDDDGGDQQ